MSVQYRIFIDDQPADRELARAIDQIVVDQLVGTPWEAQLRLATCMDDTGIWSAHSESYLAADTRFRVDIHAGGEWVPLIDGPAVGVELDLSGDPGRSSMVVRVADDTQELALDQRHHSFAPGDDLETVVRGLLEGRSHLDPEPEIRTPRTEAEDAGGPERSFTFDGSAYDFLRELADRHGLCAYVLPGDRPGRSRAVFAPLPEPDGDALPRLVLAGPERNIETFQIATSSDRPGRVKARAIRIRDREVTDAESTVRDVRRHGDEPAIADEDAEIGVEPGAAELTSPEIASTAAIARKRHAVQATGSVEGRCYHGVLRPYRHVEVHGLNAKLSGVYLVHGVTHSIDRAGYQQRFTLVRDGLSAATGGGAPGGLR